MTTEQDLAAIRSQIARVQEQKSRATVEKEHAAEQLAAARVTLKDEFGVETNEEARALQIELQRALDEALATVRAELDAAS